MSLLHKLGQKCYDASPFVIASWVIVLIGCGAVGIWQQKPLSNAITIPGTPAQQALDSVSKEFPDVGKGQGRIVFKSSNNVSIKQSLNDIDKFAQDINNVDGVNQVVTPTKNPNAISHDDHVAYIDLLLKDARGTVSKTSLEQIKTKTDVFQKDHQNLQVERGGDIVDVTPNEILGIGEAAGVLLALMVLIITLGSLIAAGMPIIVALLAVGISMGGLFGLSQFIDISITTPVLAVMLGLAVGIDYSLFIITKYRSYLKQGLDARTATAKSIATAGNAVVFAALTVIIALSALTVVNVPFMSTMGLVAAATIAISALVAITLLPALFRIFGERIISRRDRRAAARHHTKNSKKTIKHTTAWYKIGDYITNRPYLFVFGALIVVVAIAWPARYLELGLPTDQYASTDDTQRRAYDVLKDSFGVGFNAPLLVRVDNITSLSDHDVAVKRNQALAGLKAEEERQTKLKTEQYTSLMQQAVSPEQMVALQQSMESEKQMGAIQKAQALKLIDAQLVQYKEFGNILPIIDKIQEDSRVDQVVPVAVSDDSKSGIVQIIPKQAPDDPTTKQLIYDLRDGRGDFAAVKHDLQVTGSTALEADVNSKLAGALPVYLAVVVGLSFILLLIAFRSVLIPIKAAFGFLMSLAAMMGFMVMAFQWGWFGLTDAPSPIVSFVPIIGIGILFGLAMDYEFFLVSGMREAYEHTKDVKHSVAEGFSLGAKVVLAAGLIMVSIFAAFISNADVTVQSIGVGLAVGIAVDAFIVRLIFTTAVMQLLGKAAWWLPKWLDKLLPHVSIEGEDS